MENVLLSLQLAGYGLGGVFLALILFYVLIRALTAIFSADRKNRKKAKATGGES